MKIVVIGGTGLIGSKVVTLLRTRGHEVVAASPSSGVDSVTGAGLSAALDGAQVVVDLANSPSFEDRAALAFFEASGRNLRTAAAEAGVRHHVALSVVGTERLQDSGYFRAKLAQERLLESGPTPYTIVRATQFHEFVGAIAQSAVQGAMLHVSTALMQPMASDDVAAAVAEIALGAPINGRVEIAGPQPQSMAAIVEHYLRAVNDARPVVADAAAPYFGTVLAERSLLPGDGARLGAIRFADWLRQQPKPTA
jgi:uncharacterized protein YbjT (DUF2867 family)